MAIIVQFDPNGKIYAYRGSHGMLINSVAELTILAAGEPVALSSTIEFAKDFTNNPKMLALAAELCSK